MSEYPANQPPIYIDEEDDLIVRFTHPTIGVCYSVVPAYILACDPARLAAALIAYHHGFVSKWYYNEEEEEKDDNVA